MSFLLREAEERLKGSELVKLSKLIDWESLRDVMGNLQRSGYGPSSYDTVQMLKAIILQAWHNLSDPGLEEALKVRIDFMYITGFDEVPDETTICRFRNLLVKQNLFEKLLKSVNKQLEDVGLKVKESEGAIVDATIISSSRRPRKEYEAIAVDRKEDGTECYEARNLTDSKDRDSRWLKKGKKSYFGYKGFMATDVEDGYINHIHVTSANVSEVNELPKMLSGIGKVKRIYTDKGYASENNRRVLTAAKIRNGIMEKASRNKSLRESQKKFNRLISRVRYKIEQGFGTLKRRFNLARASYITTSKVAGQMTLKAIAFNLLKALNKVIKVASCHGTA